MYALAHSRPGVEQTGHWIRFCLPAALLAGHQLLGKISLPTALPLSLIEKATALSLSALAIIAEDVFNHSTPDNQDLPHVLNIDSIGVGAAAAISLYSLVSLARDATLLEGAGGFIVGGAIAVWGIYKMSQSEITKEDIHFDRGALIVASALASSIILFQIPSLHAEALRDSFDVPFQFVKLEEVWEVWSNLTTLSSLSAIPHLIQFFGQDQRDPRDYQLACISEFQSLCLGISLLSLPLGLNQLKHTIDPLKRKIINGDLRMSSLAIVAALATWIHCLYVEHQEG